MGWMNRCERVWIVNKCVWGRYDISNITAFKPSLKLFIAFNSKQLPVDINYWVFSIDLNLNLKRKAILLPLNDTEMVLSQVIWFSFWKKNNITTWLYWIEVILQFEKSHDKQQKKFK